MSRPLLLSLALVAGFVDTAAYVDFSGLFAAHVTGNFVLFAAALGRGLHDSDYLKLVTFPVFILGVFGATLAHDRLMPTGDPRRGRWLLWVVVILLAAVGAIALAFDALSPAASAALVMTMVVAMAVQNAFHRLYPGDGPATTVMTGNVTQFVVSLVRLLPGPDRVVAKPAPGADLRSLTLLVLAFAIGCVAAALLTARVGLASILAPAALLLCVLIMPSKGANGAA